MNGEEGVCTVLCILDIHKRGDVVGIDVFVWACGLDVDELWCELCVDVDIPVRPYMEQNL